MSMKTKQNIAEFESRAARMEGHVPTRPSAGHLGYQRLGRRSLDLLERAG